MLMFWGIIHVLAYISGLFLCVVEYYSSAWMSAVHFFSSGWTLELLPIFAIMVSLTLTSDVHVFRGTFVFTLERSLAKDLLGLLVSFCLIFQVAVKDLCSPKLSYHFTYLPAMCETFFPLSLYIGWTVTQL